MISAVTVDASISEIVRPVTALLDHVRVVAHEPRLDAPLEEAAHRMSGSGDPANVTAAVRGMYKRVGLDPTKYRPSSEALLRRVRRGEAVPRVNSLVDVINWCSLESRLPFGLYDFDRVQGPVVLRLGRPGEAYGGIRKDDVRVDGRLVLADDLGPFGNPTSDSARTMVTEATRRALVVIFAPASLLPASAGEALSLTVARARAFCSEPGASLEGH